MQANPRYARRAPLAVMLAALPLLVATAGCTNQIGDGCSTNLDCSQLGDLVCDVSQPGGYCTVVGCGATTCLDDATCVSFFSADFFSHRCDPRTEDAVDPNVTPTNDCAADEICLSSGQCALRAVERRMCMKPCAKDSDCRTNYECRQPGEKGSEPVLNLNDPDQPPRKFCGPIG